MKNIIITGRITKDAEVKTVKINNVDTPVCNFNVAVNTRLQEKDPATGYNKQLTEYYQVSLWRERATGLAPYLKKGREVDVMGQNFKLGVWTGRDNMIHPIMTITNPQVELKGAKPAEASAEEPEVVEIPADALPFDV